MILPLKADHIFQFSFFYATTADINGDIFVLVRVLQKLSDWVDWVAIQLFNPWGGEGHSDDSISDVGEI